MLAKVYSAGLLGMNACLFSVQVDESNGLPHSLTVGNLAPSVREGLDRARIALKNNGITLPPKRITVNIQPADLRKSGTSFDFAILVGMLLSLYRVEDYPYWNYAFIGELGLDGEIKHIPGVLPMTMAMKEAGVEGVFVGMEDVKEAKHCKGLKVIPLASVSDFFSILEPFVKDRSFQKREKSCLEKRGKDGTRPQKIVVGSAGKSTGEEQRKGVPDFLDICGQEAGIRACFIAASGMHALLFVGPAGAGKSMLAKRLAGILPPLTEEEKVEVSTVYSIAGALKKEEGLIQERPFRAPHSAISQATLLGGMHSGNLIPGELALATKGVLFLDELPLFKRETIESLRAPLEEKTVVLSRLQQVFSYKVDCILVAAMNPCPCGFFPDRNRCHCTPGQIRAYQRGVSKPILDRMDIAMELPEVDVESVWGKKGTISSKELREKVILARERQEERFRGNDRIKWNSQMGIGEVRKYCALRPEEEAFMKTVFVKKGLSMRSYHKILKVARTIADVEEEEHILLAHLAEAVSYRVVEEKFYSY